MMMMITMKKKVRSNITRPMKSLSCKKRNKEKNRGKKRDAPIMEEGTKKKENNRSERIKYLLFD